MSSESTSSFAELSLVFRRDLGPFLIRASNRVVDSKDVSWVNLLLQRLLPFDSICGDSSLHKLLSNFTNAMMVRNTATGQKDFVPSRILNRFVLLNHIGSVHAPMVQGEVNVDGSARLIDLRDTERDPDTILVKALLRSLVIQPLPHTLAQVAHVRPLAAELERLTQSVMLHGEIPCVRDEERQQVPTHSVLGTADETAEFLAEVDDRFVRVPRPFFITLKEHRAGCHLIRIKAFDFDYEEFFGSLDKICPHGVTVWLERCSKLELSVIDEANRCGPSARPAHGLHELDADLVVVEDETIIDLDLGNGTHAKHHFCHNSKVSLAAHYNMVHVGSIRDSWPQVSLGVGTRRSHIRHVAKHVLNVAVSVLLHATSTR